MDIKCEHFTFYNDGAIYINKQRTTGRKQYEDVPELAELSITVVGTKEQIDKALDDYTKKHDLCLDESYDIKVEPEFFEDGRMNYHYFGEEVNEKTRIKLEKYKKMYIENNCKTLYL